MRGSCIYTALLSVILSVAVARVNDKHAARFESLLITARAIERDESTLYKDRAHFVTLYVTVKNFGELSVCAAPVLVILETTEGLEYGQTKLLVGPPRPVPREPRTWAIQPGEETSGGYVFKVKDRAEPSELSLRFLRDTRCELNRKSLTNTPGSEEIRLNVRDLPALGGQQGSREAALLALGEHPAELSRMLKSVTSRR